jgi:hypothetical protein
MRKSRFKQFLETMARIGKRLPAGKRFRKVYDNPAGTKMAHRALATSRRGCDGTTRR